MSGECYFCESRDNPEEHHIIPQRFNGPDTADNTVDVCHDCHWKLERLYNADFYEFFGIDDPKTTQEKHIVCRHHDCFEQATEKVIGTDHATYYCEEHYEKEMADRRRRRR